MPNTIPIQTSFAGGELSPKLHGRVETELYKKALAYCENFEPLSHGPVRMKGGSEFNRILTSLNAKSRVFAFPRQGSVGYILVLGNEEMRVYSGETGEPVRAAGIDWLLNPNFQLGWQDWERSPAVYEDQLFHVIDGRYYLGPAGFAVPMPIPVLAQVFTVPAGDYTLSFTGAAANGSAASVIVVRNDTQEELAHIDLAGSGIANRFTVTASFTMPDYQSVTAYVVVQNDAYEERGVARTNVALEVHEFALRSAGSGDAAWTSSTVPRMPWLDDQLEALQMVPEPARDRVMFFHPEVEPYELIFTEETASWSFAQIAFNLGTQGDPPWGMDGNYPAAAELYQGRLIVGGIPGKENTVLGSKSGEPYDFTESSPGTNADSFNLDVSTKGSIRWLQGHRTLLMGTDRGEFILTAQGGVLTPSDFEVRAQSGYGSAGVQAIHLGDLVLYTSRDRRRLRMLSYNLQENGWQTRDLTFTSEHLTGGQIREVHWLSTGNDQVIAIMRSGEVVAWTFNRPESVIAPWRVDFGDNVYSMAILDVGDEDRVWMLVGRPGGVCLERWHTEDAPNRVLLDSYQIRPQDRVLVGIGTASGLDHLEGRSVVSIIDGIIQDPQTVTNGTITVPTTTNLVTVGLWNPPTMTTLRHEGGNPAGSSQGSKQRPVKLSLRLNDSALPLVNGDRAGADRHPETLMDTTEGRVTEDVTVRVLGWEDGAAVTITQDVPIRTEILAIYGVVATREV